MSRWSTAGHRTSAWCAERGCGRLQSVRGSETGALRAYAGACPEEVELVHLVFETYASIPSPRKQPVVKRFGAVRLVPPRTRKCEQEKKVALAARPRQGAKEPADENENSVA
jgi:hypothetical protein